MMGALGLAGIWAVLLLFWELKATKKRLKSLEDECAALADRLLATEDDLREIHARQRETARAP